MVNVSFVLVVNISCGGVNLFNIPHIIVTNITSKEIPKTNTYINLSSIQICILDNLEAKTAQKFLSFPKIQNPVLVVVEQLIEKSLIGTVSMWMDIVPDISYSWTYFQQFVCCVVNNNNHMFATTYFSTISLFG